MSVRKRILKDGAIAWQVDYRDGAGVRRHRQFPTKREADLFHAKTRFEVAAGVHTADSASITVKEAGDIWLADARRKKLEPATCLYYSEHVNLHIVPFLGVVKLSRLTIPALTHFRDQLLDNGRSVDMVRRVLTSLSSIVNTAQKRGLVAFNNVPQVERIKRDRRNRRPVMPEWDELRLILMAATELAERVPILLALFAGLRGSEIRALAWSAVDLKAGVVHVRQRADRYDHIGSPKSQAGYRSVPIGTLLLNALKAWRLRCPPNDLDLVFPAADGGIEQHINLLRHVFWPLQVRAGITRATPTGELVAKYGLHALRHAAAALWIKQGIGAKRLQVLMGHASITETYDTYGYLLEIDEADERTGFDQLTARLVPDFR
jgi:integrase